MIIIGKYCPVSPSHFKCGVRGQKFNVGGKARRLLLRPGLQRTCERISGRRTDWTIERVSRAMYDSEAGKFVRLVGVGAVDKTKQIAFYRDDWLESGGLHADQFDASDVTQLFEKCRAVIAALGDSKNDACRQGNLAHWRHSGRLSE